MAKPRIFISSTYYDLKHIRSSLDIFIERLGYESILSEKGDIAYSFDIALDESCYREVDSIDIFILIIGGRYGSEISGTDKKPSKKFHDRYESITKKEYDTAVGRDIPIYILIESNVYSEYRTFLRNKENTGTKYAYVDSSNIFYFIEDILSKSRNNPVFHFEKFEQIENWLKIQWAGTFKELLNRKTQQNQIKTLTSEIGELQEVNKTLKTYLEALLNKIEPDDSNQLIASEQKRLEDISVQYELERNPWVGHVNRQYGIDLDEFVKMVLKAKSFDGFINQIKGKENQIGVSRTLTEYKDARNDFNKVREILGLKSFVKKPIVRS